MILDFFILDKDEVIKMFRIELKKSNDAFDLMTKRLESSDTSLSSLYDSLLPWNETCSEEAFPPLYSRFVDEDRICSSWKEIEESLPSLKVLERNSDSLVLETSDERILNNLLCLHLVSANGADLKVTISVQKFSFTNLDEENLKYIFGLHGLKFSITEHEKSITH